MVAVAAGAAEPEGAATLAAPCAACHGENGVATVAGSPNLAGQNERYLLHQLELIQSNARPVPLMQGQLDGMSPEKLASLAAHYAAMPATVGRSNEEGLELGAQIYRGGIVDKGVAACSACHSPTGAGNPPAGFPQLSGQPTDYLVTQLKAFREGERDTDEDYGGMMRQVAVGLTDGEIAAVANFIRGLH